MATRNPHGARARARARRLALQGLYQWQLSSASADDIIGQLRLSQNIKDTDTDYFERLLRGVIADSGKLSDSFSPYLDRPLAQLDPIERGIFLLGTFELSACPDVPYRVVLNEAVELAKKFGADESHKYVNAVLDRAASQLRATEQGVRSSAD
jgi:transcription antitermination protein NusB